MKRNLILCGPIGCGKSTMIRQALGKEAARAGGYVTLRVQNGGILEGFDLAPAAALADPKALALGERFLSFTGQIRRNPSVFSVMGSRLLEEAFQSPYAVADEFGGVELLIPEFEEALSRLLFSQKPCIGVLKSREASEKLAMHLELNVQYRNAWQTLYDKLRRDPDTEVLQTSGRFDAHAHALVGQWVDQYVRK